MINVCWVAPEEYFALLSENFFFEKLLSKKFRVPGGLNYYGAVWCWVLFGLYGQKEISKFLKMLGVGSGRGIRKGQALGNTLGFCIF